MNNLNILFTVIAPAVLFLTSHIASAQLSYTSVHINKETVTTRAIDYDTVTGITDLLKLVEKRADVPKKIEYRSLMGYALHSVTVYEVMNSPGAVLKIEVDHDLGTQIKLSIETGIPLDNVRLLDASNRKAIVIKGPIAKRLLQILKEEATRFPHGSYAVHGTEATYGPFGDISDISCTDTAVEGAGERVTKCSIH